MFPDGNFIQNLSGHNAIINTLAVNSDGVLVSGGIRNQPTQFHSRGLSVVMVVLNLLIADNGTIHLWDWRTGYNFQRIHAAVQPGSLDSESGIFACVFDHSESRLITAEADKTIKVYKEDDMAVSWSFRKFQMSTSSRFSQSCFCVFSTDRRKPPGQLEARNPQEKEILRIFISFSLHFIDFFPHLF